jgi:hypothetical protein
MKKQITYFLILLSINLYAQNFLYVGAQNGLLVREFPDLNSKKIGKFNFRDKVEILEYSKEKITISDNDIHITGRWYKVKEVSNASVALIGFVFSGYLTYNKMSVIKEVNLNGYTLNITNSSLDEFNSTNRIDTEKDITLTRLQCLENKKIFEITPKEINLKLHNETNFTLKKQNEEEDDQFFSYSLINYNLTKNLYFFWEDWLEAGHPIMVNGFTGKTNTLVGSSFVQNKSNTMCAFFAEDIDSGWTPNGIQLFEIKNNEWEEMFDFNPSTFYDYWGPVDLKWLDNSTLLIKCVVNNADSGYFNIYKKLRFIKNNS